MSDIIAPGTLLDEQKDIVSLTTGSHPLCFALKKRMSIDRPWEFVNGSTELNANKILYSFMFWI